VFTGERRKWPFAEPGTLCGAPYKPESYSEKFKDLDVALIGVPMDLGVTNRAGARLGPRAVRSIERIGPYEHVLKRMPVSSLRVADVGDIPFRSRYSLESCHEDIEAYYNAVVDAGVIPVSCGGDHSITGSILKAVGRKAPVAMVHIDAHCDTGDDYLGSKFHHGAPFARAVEEGLLDPKRVIQIGIRGSINHKDMWKFSHDSGMRVVYMEEFTDKGWKWAAEEAQRVVGGGKTYLSFDVDSLDPAYAPGTGTPESGGLTMVEAQRLIRSLAGIDFIGADVVEVSPPFDNGTITSMNAANVLFEILCVLAPALVNRRG
jgi:agmatinase